MGRASRKLVRNGKSSATRRSESISGVFNVASGNYTVGEVGDLVKMAIEEHLGIHVHLTIHHKKDFRNYKVSTEKAKNVLSFHPVGDPKSIVGSLIDNMDNYLGWDNPLYSNIESFRALDNGIELHEMAAVAAR